jgi:hypothetical protein
MKIKAKKNNTNQRRQSAPISENSLLLLPHATCAADY